MSRSFPLRDMTADELKAERNELEEERKKLDAGWGALSDAWAELRGMQTELESISKDLLGKNFSANTLAAVTRKLSKTDAAIVRCRRKIRFGND